MRSDISCYALFLTAIGTTSWAVTSYLRFRTFEKLSLLSATVGLGFLLKKKIFLRFYLPYKENIEKTEKNPTSDNIKKLYLQLSPYRSNQLYQPAFARLTTLINRLKNKDVQQLIKDLRTLAIKQRNPAILLQLAPLISEKNLLKATPYKKNDQAPTQVPKLIQNDYPFKKLFGDTKSQLKRLWIIGARLINYLANEPIELTAMDNLARIKLLNSVGTIVIAIISILFAFFRVDLKLSAIASTLLTTSMMFKLFYGLKEINKRISTPDNVQLCYNLSLNLKKKKCIPILHRDKDVNRLACLLRRPKNKSNGRFVLVSGDSGTGKNAIIEKLTRDISKGTWEHLKGKTIYLISSPALCSLHATLDDYLKFLEKQIQGKYEDTILVFDEIQALFIPQLGEETSKSGHTLKTFLDQNPVTCIGTTTRHYQETIIFPNDKDRSFMRRIIPLRLKNLKEKEVKEILKTKSNTFYPYIDVPDKTLTYLLEKTRHRTNRFISQHGQADTILEKTLVLLDGQLLDKNPQLTLHLQQIQHYRKLLSVYFSKKELTLIQYVISYCQKEIKSQKKVFTLTPELLDPQIREQEKMSPLQKFETDLTKEAREGKIDPLIGRKEELEKLILVLNRRKKRNAILVGPAGVGKTALVEGLALAIAKEKIPSLRNTRVVSLNLNEMLSNTKYRGQFEGRVSSMLKTLVTTGNIILFIDEIHTVMRAGSAEGGSLDLANMLKPHLASGKIRVIGATTDDEYHHISQKKAFKRRFETIETKEPNEKKTLEILKGIKTTYEKDHGCLYSPKSLKEMVEQSRNLEGYWPDKAIDLMDLAGSDAKINGRKKVFVRHIVKIAKKKNKKSILNYYL